MLLLRNPEQLMLGYWLGAMTTGIASGLVIVFALQDSAEQSTKHTVSPLVQLVFAALLIVAAIALAKSKDEDREKKPKKDKKPPRWQRTLEKGNAWQTFVVGMLLSFPGASYLAALDRLIHLHYSAFAVVLIVVGFNLIQNLLLEIPMLAFKIWPTQTPAAIDRAKRGSLATAGPTVSGGWRYSAWRWRSSASSGSCRGDLGEDVHRSGDH